MERKINIFGKNSLEKLSTCDTDLQLILKTAISISNIDFGISEGFRSIELQQKFFNEGKSKIDGINKKGKHNYMPALAVDIFPVINGVVNFDNEHLSYLAGLIHAVTEILFQEGKITHKIRWGGNWNMDGTILIDQSFDDRPHFELIKP
jgi:peptidoglycan L-alanyl-D-glutamate endopeptidase CwlK